MYSSTELCKLANVTKKTLRHYDRIQLLSPAFIDNNGYWYYEEKELESIQLIKNLQTIGYTLKEIIAFFQSDFSDLRQSIPEKLVYIDEQLIHLELAKRLLKKLSAKESLNPYEAVNESLEEEHIEWYKNNLDPDQVNLVLNIMSMPESMDKHERLVNYFYTLKPFISAKDSHSVDKLLDEIRLLFDIKDLKKDTLNKLIEAFLKSNLEGPLSKRILSVNEVAYLLQRL